MANRRTNDVSAALGQLKELHALGREIGAQRAKTDGKAVAKHKTKEIAVARGMGEQRVRDAIIFAERYSADDLTELFRQCREEGHALSYRHVVRLLAVKPKSRRNQLQLAAIRGRWTVAELNSALKQRGATQDYQARIEAGAKKAGYVRGKPPKAVESIDALRAQISVDADQWGRIAEFLKRQDSIDAEDRSDKTGSFLSWSELPRDLQADLRSLMSLWDRLNGGVNAKPSR